MDDDDTFIVRADRFVRQAREAADRGHWQQAIDRHTRAAKEYTSAQSLVSHHPQARQALGDLARFHNRQARHIQHTLDLASNNSIDINQLIIPNYSSNSPPLGDPRRLPLQSNKNNNNHINIHPKQPPPLPPPAAALVGTPSATPSSSQAPLPFSPASAKNSDNRPASSTATGAVVTTRLGISTPSAPNLNNSSASPKVIIAQIIQLIKVVYHSKNGVSQMDFDQIERALQDIQQLIISIPTPDAVHVNDNMSPAAQARFSLSDEVCALLEHIRERKMLDPNSLNKILDLATSYQQLIVSEDNLFQENAELRKTLKTIRVEFEAKYRTLESVLLSCVRPSLGLGPGVGSVSSPSASSSQSSQVSALEEQVKKLMSDKIRLEKNVSVLSKQLTAEQELVARHVERWNQIKEAAKKEKAKRETHTHTTTKVPAASTPSSSAAHPPSHLLPSSSSSPVKPNQHPPHSQPQQFLSPNPALRSSPNPPKR